MASPEILVRFRRTLYKVKSYLRDLELDLSLSDDDPLSRLEEDSAALLLSDEELSELFLSGATRVEFSELLEEFSLDTLVELGLTDSLERVEGVTEVPLFSELFVLDERFE